MKNFFFNTVCHSHTHRHKWHKENWDHVYFVHPTTDISVDIQYRPTIYQLICRLTYWPMLDWYVGRHVTRYIRQHIDRHISRVSVDILTNTLPIRRSTCHPIYGSTYCINQQLSTKISPDILTGTGPICRLRIVVRQLANMCCLTVSQHVDR